MNVLYLTGWESGCYPDAGHGLGIGKREHLPQDCSASFEMRIGKKLKTLRDILQEQKSELSEVSLSNIPSSVWEQVRSKLSLGLAEDLPASAPKRVPAFSWEDHCSERAQSDRLATGPTMFAVEPKVDRWICLCPPRQAQFCKNEAPFVA